MAYGLGKDDGYFEGMRADFARRATASPAASPGSASACCPRPAPTSSTSTSRRSARATTSHSASGWCAGTGVAAIPVSAFYAGGGVRNVVRFCFAKRDDTLDRALDRLADARLVR